ncbi:MAG: D-2-hydroxyacid dehydrogenase [Firmicutes bacterium]|nr:D-2-hydroxyacid dehydrogenase [Bacillota bacterium]
MSKIVILDGYAANPGDISWEPLKEFGEVVLYDRTKPEEVIERISGADFVFTNKVPVTAESMDSCPTLKWIGVLATGYNIVDVAYAKEKGIPVTNIPAYSTDTVAQNVFAHLFNITNRVADHAASIRDGKWARCRDFTFWDYPQMEMAGKTLGIVGFGSIGKKVASIARAFGMKVLVFTRTPDPSLECGDLSFCDKETLLKESDVVSLHCPLTDATREMINKESLALMKPTAILINTGRGPLINEADLAEALKAGKIYGAGLDVLCKEPPEADNPLFECENCFISPHVSWASDAARVRLHRIAFDNIRSFVEGKPVNVVNGL